MESFSGEQVVLNGEGGFFDGEEYILLPGKTYTVGRSSLCEISLKSTARFQTLEEEGLLLDDSFRLTSGKHFTITVHDSGEYANTATDLKVRIRGSIKVVIKCISENGISVNGKRFTELIIPDLGTAVHYIEFGAGEKFRLSLRKLS